MDTPGNFSVMIYKGDNFWDFMFTFQHFQIFLKKVYLKSDEFAPKVGKFIPISKDPFWNRFTC